MGGTIITGGGAGIGLALAQLLVGGGQRVGLIDSDERALTRVADDLAGVAIAVADVADPDAVTAAVDRLADAMDGVSAVAAVAGISRSAAAADMSVAQWDAVIGVGLRGAFVTARAAFPHLRQSCGALAFVGSTASLGGFAGRANYAAAKTGLIGLMRTLAIEWGQHGIRVNMVAPGSIATERALATIPADYAEGVIVDRTPLGRHGEPREVAACIAFLLSEAAPYVSGAVLPVDGGMAAGYLTHLSGADRGGLPA